MTKETTPVGLYTVKSYSDITHWILKSGGKFKWFSVLADAEFICEEINAAYRAGQASREQQTPAKVVDEQVGQCDYRKPNDIHKRCMSTIDRIVTHTKAWDALEAQNQAT